MSSAKRILTYIAVLLIVIIVGGLTGWYLYLRSNTAATGATDAARGLGSDSPVFSGNLGSNSATDISGVAAAPTTGTQQNPRPAQRLWQADHAPVAGMGFVLPSASTSAISLYFVERGNGYVFDADAVSESSQRLTNTLLPRTYEALLVPGVDGVVLRSLDEGGRIKTVLGSFASSTTGGSFTTQALTTRDLPLGIRSIAADPASGALLYLTPNATSFGANVTSSTWANTKPKQIFSSTITSWRLQLMNGAALITEKPADDMDGYAYTLSSAGASTLLLGPISGLEVLPNPTEKALLFSSSSGGTLTLFAKIGNGNAAQLPIHTVAGKCVWAPGKSLIAYCAVPSSIGSAHFLDDWYQGILHTSDTWWQIDTSAGTAEVLYTPNQSLDVQNPVVDPSGNYIAFQNGSDQSLWLLRIAQ